MVIVRVMVMMVIVVGGGGGVESTLVKTLNALRSLFCTEHSNKLKSKHTLVRLAL